jgi:hypothetical protein
MQTVGDDEFKNVDSRRPGDLKNDLCRHWETRGPKMQTEGNKMTLNADIRRHNDSKCRQ